MENSRSCCFLSSTPTSKTGCNRFATGINTGTGSGRMRALLDRALNETHAMDRRRIHFLRMGRTSAETVEKTSALYIVLLDKSRDEIEQMILEREQALPPRDYQSYLFTIFDLQRFFQESYARSIPQALNRERLDALFVEELCRLAADGDFWQGFAQNDRLPYSLVRYLIMYFDAAPEEPGNLVSLFPFPAVPAFPSQQLRRRREDDANPGVRHF